MSDSAVQKCPLSVICPIVFIPGIMGSRLRRKSNREIVWDPGAATWDQVWHTLGLGTSGAAAKRELLIGGPSTYFSSDILEVDHAPGGWRADNGYRGLLGSYLPFVNWLNQEKITKIDDCIVMIQFMVWACPYNWSDTNRISAKYVGEVVAEAERVAAERASMLGRQSMKPIIVTHSMGGLVSRAYTQLLGGAGSVHGVIHGAMPTHGSPELYKRIRSGFEGGTKYILGSNQEQVTATAANMPGPLELAPNRIYQDVPGSRRWLRARDGVGSVLWELPVSDPYSEIYLNSTDWYRLVERTLLNPGGDSSAAWRAYQREIIKAQRYHAELETQGFHPNTRMFYGTRRPTRDRVSWRPIERFPGPYPAKPVASSSNGRVVLRGLNPDHPDRGMTFSRTLNIDGPEAQGDGTVQAGSGIHVDQMSVAITDGFEHQGAFDSSEARRLTVDWLVEMVKEAVS